MAPVEDRSWHDALLELANADDADPAADKCRPPEVRDAGPWRGATLDGWHARMNTARLDPAEVRRASFRLPRQHAGAIPVVTGPGRSRRAVERTQVA